MQRQGLKIRASINREAEDPGEPGDFELSANPIYRHYCFFFFSSSVKHLVEGGDFLKEAFVAHISHVVQIEDLYDSDSTEPMTA